MRLYICDLFLQTRCRGVPGLVDGMFVAHTDSRRSDFHRRHMSEQFFRSNRLGYQQLVCSELLEKSGNRRTDGECSVTERRRWRPPYQIGKTVLVHAKTLQTQRGRKHDAGVRGYVSVPLSHSGGTSLRELNYNNNSCKPYFIMERSFSLANVWVYIAECVRYECDIVRFENENVKMCISGFRCNVWLCYVILVRY